MSVGAFIPKSLSLYFLGFPKGAALFGRRRRGIGEFTQKDRVMIIWNGLGILVVLAVGLMMVAVDAGSGVLGLVLSKAQSNGAGIVLAGLLVGAWGLYLRRQPGRALIDKETGAEVVLRPRHSLFWIPVLYWGPILVVLGAVLAIKG